MSRSTRGYRLTAVQWFPRRRSEVFDFFADARNLERITPANLRFTIVSSHDLAMREGLLIEYRLRVHGIPVRWQTEIAAWEPDVRFVDRQRRGPYRLWEHEHRFEDHAGGTLMYDEVDYDFACSRIAHPLLVRHDLQRIFTYRYEVMADEFGGRGRERELSIAPAASV
ncbi:MAG: SRPBCC family protein [Phycisphaerales bacterium]|nr:SRPBCC family protein [Phycisphaerales bacterium]